MKPIISFKNFNFKYANQENNTLKNINLDIYPGEKILILGKSGSGKSTLGNCINGLIPNQYKGFIDGQCLVCDKKIDQTSIFDLSKVVGTVLQDSDAQFVGLNVGEDIAFYLENRNIDYDKMHELVAKSANKVGVLNQLDILPYSLSGGQKQRVSVAGILHEDIKVLLLDEPLAALDPHMGETMIELIDQFSVEGKTVVIIEHRFEEVLHRKVDRVILMNDGEIVDIRRPDELINSDMLVKYGIREPLYISALKNLYGGLKQSENLTNLETIDLSYYRNIKLNYFEIFNEKKLGKKIIDIKNIKFGYEDKENINIEKLEIYQGERIAIVGENGSGKTTLARILTGVVKPQNGSITRENNPETIQEIATQIGYVMQNPNQMLVTTNVYDEIALSLKLRKYKEEDIKEKVEKVLKITGLYKKRNWPISSLSYGQKKRLSVAVVLVLEPKCIILDEPTAGQDYHHYREIMEFINKLNKEENITIIFITHDMHLALEYTDRILVIKDGKIIEDNDTFKVLNDDRIIKEASLKKTSIFELARKLNQPIHKFIRLFIEKESETYYE